MDWQNATNTHLITLLYHLVYYCVFSKELWNLFHTGVFINYNLYFLRQFPILLIPNSKVNWKVSNVQILVWYEFDGNLSFFNELLLFHGFLSVNFSYFLGDSLTNSELMWLNIDLFVLFEYRYEFEFNFWGF